MGWDAAASHPRVAVSRLLQINLVELVTPERTHLVADDVLANWFVDDGVRQRHHRCFLVGDDLHLRVELCPLGLIGHLLRFLEQLLEVLIAPLCDVVAALAGSVAAKEEEEVVRIAVVATPA